MTEHATERPHDIAGWIVGRPYPGAPNAVQRIQLAPMRGIMDRADAESTLKHVDPARGELLAVCRVRAPLTTEELADVAERTVVRAADGTIAARYDAARGVVFGDDRPFPWSVLRGTAEILWQPKEAAR